MSGQIDPRDVRRAAKEAAALLAEQDARAQQAADDVRRQLAEQEQQDT